MLSALQLRVEEHSEAVNRRDLLLDHLDTCKNCRWSSLIAAIYQSDFHNKRTIDT